MLHKMASGDQMASVDKMAAEIFFTLKIGHIIRIFIAKTIQIIHNRGRYLVDI